MAADPDCLFCKIVAGEVPATRVHEDERTVAFMDINPATRGHLLVIPREHAADVHAIDPEDLRPSRSPRKALAQRVRDTLGADGVNLLNSAGSVAWQTVFHFHLHVIPRYEGDPLRLPWHPRAGRPRRDRGRRRGARRARDTPCRGGPAWCSARSRRSPRPRSSRRSARTRRLTAAASSTSCAWRCRAGVDGRLRGEVDDGEGVDDERPAHGRGPVRLDLPDALHDARAGLGPRRLARLRDAGEGGRRCSAAACCATAPTGCRGRSAAVDRDAADRAHRLPALRPVGDRPAGERALRRRGRHARRPLPEAARLPRHGAGRSDDRKV